MTALKSHLSTLMLAAILLAATAHAGSALRSVKSANGRFTLRLMPGQPIVMRARPCQATLLERAADGPWIKRWERIFVNDIAPEKAFVRNDGRYVVTLNEYRRGGARHALVIYGAEGEMLRHFVLTDLLRRDDWEHVVVNDQRVAWLAEAEFEFADLTDEFIIRLPWQREIRVDLRSPGAIPVDEDDSTGWSVISKDMRELLFGTADPAERPGIDVSEPSKDVQIAQAQPPQSPVKSPQPDAAGPQAEPNAPPAEPNQPSQPQPDPTRSRVAQPRQPSTIVVPRPDPNQPVDYVAWLNQQVSGDGERAAEYYGHAIQALVNWHGDPMLYRHALDGHAGVFANPELRTWLETNRVALANFRAGSHRAFSGFQYSGNGDPTLANLRLPDLAPMRLLAKLAIVAGHRAAADGRQDDAASIFLDTSAAGAHLAQGMSLIENVAGFSIESMARAALMDQYADDTDSKIDYVSLAQQLDVSMRRLRPFADLVRFEQAAALSIAQAIFKPVKDGDGYRLDDAKAREVIGRLEPMATPEMIEDALDVLRARGFEETIREVTVFYDALASVAALSYPEAVPLLDEVEAYLLDTGVNPLLRTQRVGLQRFFFLRARAETDRRGAQLLTELKAYRQRHGGYPESLDVFGDRDFVIDPFTGQPFAYRRDGEQIKLYSLGTNATDDHGRHDRTGARADYVIWPRPGVGG